MGDRVLVTFKDAGGMVAPVYMHWAGHDAVQMVRDAVTTLRRGDASYSAARFCAYACTRFKGVTGVGILAKAPDLDNSDDSHGDAGILVVDVDSGEMKGYHGYLSEKKIKPVDVSQMPES